jgi:homoserine dehydrogenase
VKRMPDFDAKFEQMRSEAAKEGQVLRFVGIVDVVKKEIKADLRR